MPWLIALGMMWRAGGVAVDRADADAAADDGRRADQRDRRGDVPPRVGAFRELRRRREEGERDALVRRRRQRRLRDRAALRDRGDRGLGTAGTLAAAVPVTLIGIAVLLEQRRLRSFVPAHATSRTGQGTDDWVSFGKLSAFVTARAMAYFGFVAFVPLYVVEVLHGSPALGDTLLTAFLAAGVARHALGRADRRSLRPPHGARVVDGRSPR